MMPVSIRRYRIEQDVIIAAAAYLTIEKKKSKRKKTKRKESVAGGFDPFIKNDTNKGRIITSLPNF